MTNVEILSVAASIASLALAILAIWLSITFFKMSSDLSVKTTEAAKGIIASVERLEKLFDKLYADTFSMMRDTVSDMRKHIWPEDKAVGDKLGEENEKRADEKVSKLKESMEREVAQMLQRQKITDDKVASLRVEMRSLLDKAITGSRQVEIEAREEITRTDILNALRLLSRRHGDVRADRLVDFLGGSPDRVIEELRKMRGQGLVSLSDENIRPETLVRIPSIVRQPEKAEVKSVR